jgi:hypothetical protein
MVITNVHLVHFQILTNQEVFNNMHIKLLQILISPMVIH